MQRLNRIKRLIRADAGLVEKLVKCSLAVAVPTALQSLLNSAALGVPFALYYPANLAIAVIFGWRWATGTTVASTLAAAFLVFEPDTFTENSFARSAGIAVFLSSNAVIVWVGDRLRVAMIALQRQAELVAAFNDELQHRTRNIFQVVRSLAARARHTTDPQRFYGDLMGRLDALSKANDLLQFGVIDACSVRDLVDTALGPFDQGQFAVSVSDSTLSQRACTPLVMALHELATNATKYGSLSVPGGRVEVVSQDEGGQAVRITWRESGGPPVRPPERRGLGSRLLAPQGDVISVDVDYRTEGVVCEMVARRP